MLRMMRSWGIMKSGADASTFDFHWVADDSGYSEQDLQRQISLTKNQLRDLRMSNDSNQAKLIDHSQRQGKINKSNLKHCLTKPIIPNRSRSRCQTCWSWYDCRRSGTCQQPCGYGRKTQRMCWSTSTVWFIHIIVVGNVTCRDRGYPKRKWHIRSVS